MLDPIYEHQHITRDEMVELPCRSMHRIQPRSVKIQEDDNLYAIYAPHINKPVMLMSEWLKCSALSNSALFNKCANNYLKSKGMTLEVWIDTIREGRKGDILSLYALSMLLDAHMVVHLHNGEVWSTLQTVPTEHGEVISWCLIHLAYLGRGLYIELTRGETPLVVVPPNITDMPNVESLVVEELTVAGTQTSNQTLESDPTNIDAPLDLSTEKILFTQCEPETALDLSLTKENRAPSSDITQCNDLALNLTSSEQGQDAHTDPRPPTLDATK